MPPSRTRFVTACQQMLALGAVLAVLTPAATVVSLDVVHDAPAGTTGQAATPATTALAAYSRELGTASAVPTGPVEAGVREVALTAPSGVRGRAAARVQARRTTAPAGSAALRSRPQRVTGYGAVGVTWQHGRQVHDEDISFSVRTRDGGRWTGWAPMAYHDEHGPDPDSPEGRRARPGTTELLVGDVEKVQVRVVAEGELPPDMRLAVIDPGEAASTTVQRAAIETGAPIADEGAPTGSESGDEAGGEDALALRAATYTPAPTIYSRAQWGADERLRDSGSLRYYEVHAGFVHHTVNANDYTREQVPAILRSIYAYHTRSKGWSDVGYNYLVDRFGRIWEGRYGGVDRPVVGAHTLGYNDYSFALSAIGNFDVAKPPAAMVQAYGALFAWKLSLHGVSASSTRQPVGSRTFPAVNGHRDAGSTACPGRYLYAKLKRIRTLATTAQRGWAGRELESHLVGSPQPDLVVRRASDKVAVLLPTDNGVVGAPVTTNVSLAGANRVLRPGDWDRDGHGDLLTREAGTGVLHVRRGSGTGRFGPPVQVGTGFGGVRLLAAVGDMTGDGFPDLMGQPRRQSMRIYPGRGLAPIGPSYVAFSKIRAKLQVPVGLWDGDGAPDSLLRSGTRLSLYAGNGPGGFSSTRALPLDLTPYDWVVGTSDADLAGHADLFVREKATGRLLLLPATATGFGAARVAGKGMTAYDMVG